jgi:hypothetical protein
VRGDLAPPYGSVRRSQEALQRTVGESDGSFEQVETLESLRMLPRDRSTRKLLAMKRHPGARIEHETRSQTS